MGVLALPITLRILPGGPQEGIAWAVRSTLLRPFLKMQETVVNSRIHRDELDQLRQTADSLGLIAAAASELEADNRSLRELMGMTGHPALGLVGATLVRLGPPANESMFVVDLGLESGVAPDAPVFTPAGLLGRIVDAREGMALGIDWTHGDFRASAMLADGEAYGIVYRERGTYREEDRLVLDGLPYHGDAVEGKLVVTSGLGSVFPRGIPIGIVSSLRAEREPWAKTYWLTPAVEPASVRYAAIGKPDPQADLRILWHADTIAEPHPDSLDPKPGE